MRTDPLEALREHQRWMVQLEEEGRKPREGNLLQGARRRKSVRRGRESHAAAQYRLLRALLATGWRPCVTDSTRDSLRQP